MNDATRHTPRRPIRRGLVYLTGLLVFGACAGSVPPVGGEARLPTGDCVAAPLRAGGRPADEPVRWLVRSARSDRHTLDEWCRGVGAPVITRLDTVAVRVDSVAVVTWNINVGAARVDDFIADLRSGSITGSPIEHFVLLVQEARRGGDAVPAVLQPDGRGARRLGLHGAGAEADIVATARRLGLRLFYAPSMRNGGRDDDAEDRGNAILTTLPLLDLTAIELPLLAQRRVAVAATVPLLDADGRRRELRVSSVHLDFGASADRPLAPFGPGRTLQAGALADALNGDRNVVVGGDFNTWSLPRLEGGLTLMQEGFPDFPAGNTSATFHTAGILPRRLDHLFLRAVDASGTAPARIDDRYGSDHFPLIAWVRFDGFTAAP